MNKLMQRYSFDWRRIQFKDSYHIEYCITDICNKSCVSCSHLAPLAKKPNLEEIEKFAKFTSILAKLIPNTHTFWLTGGEPTMHPQFILFLKIASRLFTSSYIGIYSNGITLKRYEYDDSFWNYIRNNNIVWAITSYDTEPKYFEDLFAKHDCLNNLAIIHNGQRFLRLTNYACNQEISKEKYEKCGWEKSKINVRNGKIFNCPSAEFVDLFNDHFKMDLQLSADDYLMIDENLTREAIDKFRGPSSFCGSCDLSKRHIEFFKNVPSEKKKSEWSSF